MPSKEPVKNESRMHRRRRMADYATSTLTPYFYKNGFLPPPDLYILLSWVCKSGNHITSPIHLLNFPFDTDQTRTSKPGSLGSAALCLRPPISLGLQPLAMISFRIFTG